MTRLFHALTLIALLLSVSATQSGAPANSKVIRLATTTSTENSGLLRYLLPVFERQTRYRVHVIAVGTGKALRMGREGDVDLVLVHAPQAEQAFVRAGYGVDRQGVMYNDFVIAGPATDPAAVGNTQSASAALAQIAATESPFVSRGDDSGTHKKELALWKQAGIEPADSWYREAGQGMGKVLQIAGEMDAYTLTDRGTWLAYREKSPLRLLAEGDPQLFNPYGIIAVNPARYPDINYGGAKALIQWITAPEGQRLIGDFRIVDNRLFTPSASAPPVAGNATE